MADFEDDSEPARSRAQQGRAGQAKRGPGERLRRWRLVLGLTQGELGTVLGVSGAHISRMERGHVPVSRRVQEFYLFVLATRPLGDAVSVAVRTRGGLAGLATLLCPFANADAEREVRSTALSAGSGPSYAQAMDAARAALPGRKAARDPYALPPELEAAFTASKAVQRLPDCVNGCGPVQPPSEELCGACQHIEAFQARKAAVDSEALEEPEESEEPEDLLHTYEQSAVAPWLRR